MFMLKLDVEKIKNTDFYKTEFEIVRKHAEKLIETPIPAILLSTIKEFNTSGNRHPFEDLYFNKRGRLSSYFIMYIFEGEKIYLEALEDVIWSICEETSWSVAAHYSIDSKVLPVCNFKYWIDLFAAETAFAFAEIYVNLEDKLSDIIKDRMRNEVRERIIESYLENKVHFWWENASNNWAAVCGGSVGGAFLQFGSKEETERALPRLQKVMDAYLSGFKKDGACVEGLGYWHYGFGYFTYFADLLKIYSSGEIDLFKSEKIENIAKFQQKAFLAGNNISSFSDAGRESNYPIGLTHYLYNKYNGIEIPDKAFIAHFGSDQCYRFAAILRNFAWYDENIKNIGLKEEAFYPLPDAGWYIKRSSPFAFAAKGGNNGEPHNHNDLGGFIVFKNRENIICDLGIGIYNKQYFHPSTRYDILCNGSQGHSVPIINGEYQKEGKEHYAEVLICNENEFSIEMSRGYLVETLKSLIRTWNISGNEIRMVDKFTFSGIPQRITERFITLTEPKVYSHYVQIGNAKISYSNNMVCEINTAIHTTRKDGDIIVYLIDFNVTETGRDIQTEFVIL